MRERIRATDPGELWRGQPPEQSEIDVQALLVRRTKELGQATRAEVFGSLASAALLILIVLWRFGGVADLAIRGTVALAGAWIAISLYCFRRRLWSAARQESVTAPSREYYRQELVARRDHVRNLWLWHGPMFLACVILVAILLGSAWPTLERVRGVLPLVGALAVWSAFGYARRRRQASELQAEIDELDRLGRET